MGERLKKIQLIGNDDEEELQVFNKCISHIQPYINKGYKFIPYVINMYFRRWRACRLMMEYEKKNDFKYDYVIRHRFDVIVPHYPDLEHIGEGDIYGHNDTLGVGKRDTFIKAAELGLHFGMFSQHVPVDRLNFFTSCSQESLWYSHCGIRFMMLGSVPIFVRWETPRGYKKRGYYGLGGVPDKRLKYLPK